MTGGVCVRSVRGGVCEGRSVRGGVCKGRSVWEEYEGGRWRMGT